MSGLAHAVAFAAAELHLIAVDGVILLDFKNQIGVGQVEPGLQWWVRRISA